MTSVDRGLALLLLFETPLLLPGFLFLRCGSFVWLVGMSSQGIKCTLARDVLSLLFGVLGAGCFCPGLHWEDCQFCLWCDLRLVSDDLVSFPNLFLLFFLLWFC